MLLVSLLLLALSLGLAHGQAQCPPDIHVNSIFVANDRTINVPLTEPLCLRCRFFDSGGERIPFSDGVWARSISGSNTENELNNGSFSGNVAIFTDSTTTILFLNNTDDVVNVGDRLICSSATAAASPASTGRTIITIGAFVFLDPAVSPNGVVDVIEGANQTLTCSDPGNSGQPRYVWMNDSDDSELTIIVNNPPLTLSLTELNRTASGNYTCRSTNNDLPGVNRDTTITINVQYLDLTSDPLTHIRPRGTNYTLTCSFSANPLVNSVTWSRNGTSLDPTAYTHISVNTQPTSSQLIFSPLEGLDDSGEYTCEVSNGVLTRSRSLLNLTVEVNPSPVGSLMAPTNDITNTSVRLTWTLGFNGNAALTGGSVSYTAISNGVGSDQSSFTGETVTQYTVTGLQPLTTYRFNVSVTNPVGDSTVETVVAITLANVPNAPTLNDVRPVNSTTLQATWTNNTDAMTQSAVTTYSVEYYPEGQDSSSVTLTVNAPTTTVMIVGLSKGTRYTVQVYANNAIGSSSLSNLLTARTDIDPPSSATAIILSPYPDSMCVSWGPPDDNGGEPITGYRISYRNLNTSSDVMVRSPGPTVSSLLLMNLDKETRYEITVAATNNEGGIGENTTNIRATGSPFSVDDTIGLMVNGITALTAQISWTVLTDNQNLRLQYRRLGMEWSNDREMTFSPDATNYKFMNLTSETTYELRLITLIMGSCEQRTSNTVNFTTIELQVVVNTSNTTTFTAGERIVLTCDLDTGGAPPTDVMWMYNDGSIPSTATADGNTLTLSAPSVDDSGNYTCSFRNASYTFALMINPAPPSPTTNRNSLPSYVVYIIAGVVAAIIVVFIIIVIIISCCCVCKKKESTDLNLKGNRKGSDGMWLDPGGSGFSPHYISTTRDSPDFGRTPERSYTNNFQSASSFETKKVKGESQENLTSDAPEERYTTTSKPFAEQRVEYATVGSSTFTKQSDV